LSDSTDKARVLIVFYSRDGSTEALANAIADGARDEGADVRVRRVRELVSAETMALAPGWAASAERMNALFPAPTSEDAIWSEAVCMGSPSRFGSPSSEIRAWVETLGSLWVRKQLLDKVGSAFGSVSSPHGGLETTILGLYPTMMHLGLIIVPQGYGHAASMRAGTPYGVGAVSGGGKRLPPTEDDLDIARHQGARVAKAAIATRQLRPGA
jgi:NAD(P)H dehydrogenase (quinone)